MSQTARVLLAAATTAVIASSAFADGAYQTLPHSQNWSNVAMITVNNDWSGVPGYIGYRGDDLTVATGFDPQAIVVDGTSTPVNVNAQVNPTTFTSGGLAECDALADPTIAFQGSGTSDVPLLFLHLNTTGFSGITVSYNLRDVDANVNDNAVQPVALQYRVGLVGDFTNVPAAFVADATQGPGLSGLVTPVSVVLPAAVSNQAQVQVRWVTTNA